MDKLAKVKAEIERLKLCTMDEYMKFYSESAEAEYNALCKIDAYIDSMQKEHASEDCEKAAKQASEYLPIEAGEAVDANGDIYETDDKNYPERFGFIKGFKAGANWQRQKDEHLIWQTSTANYEKGREEGKQQMMKDAIEIARKEIFEKMKFYIESMVSDITFSDVDGNDNYDLNKFIEDLKQVMKDE